jgi:hypothetical protein
VEARVVEKVGAGREVGAREAAGEGATGEGRGEGVGGAAEERGGRR